MSQKKILKKRPARRKSLIEETVDYLEKNCILVRPMAKGCIDHGAIVRARVHLSEETRKENLKLVAIATKLSVNAPPNTKKMAAWVIRQLLVR